MDRSRTGMRGGPTGRHRPIDERKNRDMSVNPEALGDPPQDADEYLQEANADDPRSDPGPPAREPAGQEDADQTQRPAGPDPL
ncbi:hypothetical protein Aab01nite_82530 [Paractinoplanes abujensis]|nr:hypothetical protein Aab01nite_82530 [Actinoplanes abujensis]